MKFAARAEAALRRDRRPITRPRRALLELIERSPKPLGPRELHRELRRAGVRIDRVSVYRNVAALLELGLLHRVLGSTAVRPCVERAQKCHHAIVCTACGSAREFHSVALEKALGDVRRSTRYRVLGHLLELRGLCESCR
ncbi:MAG: transcriptional repressor [Myxococcales bacterium]|nr:transcriptional repressor [Myxococcales bacterium]